jgi:acyl-CoA reductase-like NAD-dependent aldehyde dehydrogenase
VAVVRLDPVQEFEPRLKSRMLQGVIRTPELDDMYPHLSDEALAEANAPAYGLTAGVFTEDTAEKERFLAEIEAGVVYVNRRAGATTGAAPGSAPEAAIGTANAASASTHVRTHVSMLVQ